MRLEEYYNYKLLRLCRAWFYRLIGEAVSLLAKTSQSTNKAVSPLEKKKKENPLLRITLNTYFPHHQPHGSHQTVFYMCIGKGFLAGVQNHHGIMDWGIRERLI